MASRRGCLPQRGDAVECANPNTFDPLDPCSVYNEDDVEALGLDIDQFGGYMLITDAVDNRAGNAFRAEPDFYENFKLEVVVELRDGSIGRPADGMVVVIVGGDDPPERTDFGGGGMGTPCVGGIGPGDDDLLPMMAFEFDNWSCTTTRTTSPSRTRPWVSPAPTRFRPTSSFPSTRP